MNRKSWISYSLNRHAMKRLTWITFVANGSGKSVGKVSNMYSRAWQGKTDNSIAGSWLQQRCSRVGTWPSSHNWSSARMVRPTSLEASRASSDGPYAKSVFRSIVCGTRIFTLEKRQEINQADNMIRKVAISSEPRILQLGFHRNFLIKTNGQKEVWWLS